MSQFVKMVPLLIEGDNMKPTGQLMIGHRLIERMVALLKKELNKLKNNQQPNPQFILNAVDFFRTYADRTHHGKEEGILFKELINKKLSEEHKKIMGELVAEHVTARKNVKELLEANEEYAKGDAKAISKIISPMKTLTSLYPSHIAKEDKQFFSPVLKYLNEGEQHTMLKNFLILISR